MMLYNIGIDCMGFENSPQKAIDAAICFWKKHKELQFTFFGDKEYLQVISKKNNPKFHTVFTCETIKQNDTPVSARYKINSSMFVGIDFLKNDKIDAFLTAGSSSVCVSSLYTNIGVFDKLSKPAFMPFLPTVNKRGVNLLDVGANISPTAQDICNLALIGSICASRIRNISNPHVAVLNIGTESCKGPLVLQEANRLLQKNPNINYIGFIEPRNIFWDLADVIVCDGYAGNMVLKSLEGTMTIVAKLFKKSIVYNPLSLLFSFNLFRKICQTFDYKNNAGAIVVGIKKLVVKTHGSSGRKEFYSSIKLVYSALKSGLMDCLAGNFS